MTLPDVVETKVKILVALVVTGKAWNQPAPCGMQGKKRIRQRLIGRNALGNGWVKLDCYDNITHNCSPIRACEHRYEQCVQMDNNRFSVQSNKY